MAVTLSDPGKRGVAGFAGRSGDTDPGSTTRRRRTRLADATQDSTETTQEPCPADDCDSGRAHCEMLSKPGGSYEVRLFTYVECGHKWRES